MLPEMIQEIEQEIERLRRRHAALAREASGALEVVARWTVEATGICWVVPLQGVAEPDIDVEITGEVLVVRADRTWPEPAVLVGILPVPGGFDPDHPAIRFIEETLEVRIRRAPHGAGS
jgi:hypothetical protein